MTKLQGHCSSALGLLAILCISTAVSLAQRPRESSSTTTSTKTSTADPVQIDPFAVLPASDVLIVLDLKRFTSDVVPRLLVDEPEARALVVVPPKTIELLDPRAIQRFIAGFRYSNPQNEKSDFEVVTVAQSSEAGKLPALIRAGGLENTGKNSTPEGFSISRS